MLNDLLKLALYQSRMYKHKDAVLFIDLDDFKSVNDNHGHESGDHLLRGVAARLKNSLRDSDIAARIGGDEFVILVPVEESPEGIITLSLKLIDIISQPYSLSGIAVTIGASIGIRHFSDDPGQYPENLLADADQAMYKAKSAEKGRYSVYGD